MRNLYVRAISAAVAILILLVATYFLGTPGLRGVCLLICTVGIYEYGTLTIRRLSPSESVTTLFWFFCLLLFLSATLFPYLFFDSLGVLVCVYVAAVIWLARDQISNDSILNVLAYSLCGFLYVALLPALAIQLLSFPDGWKWFLLLLAVVFSGDTLAYIGGSLLGGRKLMASISPHKTISGAVSGLSGSVTAALIVNHFSGLGLGSIQTVSLALFAALLAQNGDLFKSLLKRVAQQKDSGRLMPGHGGVLDRLDGVYFAAPVFYFAAGFLSRHV